MMNSNLLRLGVYLAWVTGSTAMDTGPVTMPDGSQQRNVTYQCPDGSTDTLTWRDGGWTPESVMPCMDRSSESHFAEQGSSCGP